jgi:hypothetical protein
MLSHVIYAVIFVLVALIFVCAIWGAYAVEKYEDEPNVVADEDLPPEEEDDRRLHAERLPPDDEPVQVAEEPRSQPDEEPRAQPDEKPPPTVQEVPADPTRRKPAQQPNQVPTIEPFVGGMLARF